MYKVALFVVMMSAIPSAYSSAITDLDFTTDLSSASFKREVISAIEYDLKKSQERIITGICQKLLIEQIQKFKWLSESMSKQQGLTLEHNKL